MEEQKLFPSRTEKKGGFDQEGVNQGQYSIIYWFNVPDEMVVTSSSPTPLKENLTPKLV